MSNYTVEVRDICERYSSTTEPNMAIESSLPFIFNDLWTVYVPQGMTLEARKKDLERKILRHYYFREIAFETVPMWITRLNWKLAELMPLFNKMAESLDYDFEDACKTKDMNGESHGTTNTNGTDSKNSSQYYKPNSSSQTERSGRVGDSTLTLFSDTPMGKLDHLLSPETAGNNEASYLTNATKVISTGDDGKEITKTTNAGTNTTTSSGSGTTNRVGQSTGDTHTYGRDVPLYEVSAQYRELLDDIDLRLINAIQNLFLEVY